MSDTAISKDCLHHYDNRHIQVRWDFYCLCSYDKSKFNQRLTKNGKKAKDEPNQECMAKILRLLETLTNHEKTDWSLKAQKLKEQGLNPPPEPKEFPLQLSYGAICSLLYDTYGESAVRNSIAYLIQLGFIKQYQQTKNSIPFYALQIRTLQKALKDQAEREISGVEIDTQSGEKFQVSKSTARRPKSTAKPSNSTGGGVEFDNNNNSKNNKKPEEGKNANESTTPNDSLSSTPSLTSLSQVEHLSTIAVDKQANGVDNTQLPIATATTRNASNQRNTEPLTLPPDSEATRVFNLLCEVFYAIPPDVITEHISKQCASLAPHVRNVEDMKSLKDYTRAQILEDPRYKKKRVYLGNLVDHLDGWKQEQAPLLVAVGAQQPEPKTRKQAYDEWVASQKADPWK